MATVTRERRDLRGVSTAVLEGMADTLGKALVRARVRGADPDQIRKIQDGIADIEAELIDRIIALGRALPEPVGNSPSDIIVRIAHRDGGTGRYFAGGAS